MNKIDSTSANVNNRIKSSHRKLVTALRRAGARVGKWDKTRFVREIDGVPTFISFYLAGRFAAPTAEMRLSFGEKLGRRLMLREPKKGFDFAMCAQRACVHARGGSRDREAQGTEDGPRDQEKDRC